MLLRHARSCFVLAERRRWRLVHVYVPAALVFGVIGLGVFAIEEFLMPHLLDSLRPSACTARMPPMSPVSSTPRLRMNECACARGSRMVHHESRGAVASRQGGSAGVAGQLGGLAGAPRG